MTMNRHQTTMPPERYAAPWAVFLVAASALDSLVFACATPFAGLAAVAAMTLPTRLVLATSAGVWLANQAVGYGLLDYPVDATSLSWGLALGIASLAAAAAAGRVARSLRGGAEPARWVAAFAAALAVHQGLLFAASFVLGGEGFTPAAVGGIVGLNAIWAAGLAVLHHVLVVAHGGIALGVRRAG